MPITNDPSRRTLRRVALALFASLSLAGCECVGSVSDYGDAAILTDGSVVVLADGGGTNAGSDGGPSSVDAGPPIDAGIGPSDAGCPVVSCEGQCGPVRDFCRGEIIQCGGCPSGRVCDLVDHKCEVPALTCNQLGAQCGQIRNSCGTRLNCGACGTNQECDRNTHTCVGCTNPTCGDLGYECGQVWLGCGPFTNTTNCGSCGSGKTCNTALHKCEPTCTPGSDSAICAAAGATCGLISNGCGGMANCGGCPNGTSCGARGIGNRCDKPEQPEECVASYRNCGLMVSACGGGTIDCGTCPDGEVCGVEGRCTGDPTCSTYGANGKAMSPCSNGQSASFPSNAGNLECACEATDGGQCNLANSRTKAPVGIKGVCCVNTVTCGANECNTTKINECTGATITCGCNTPGTHCNNGTRLCEMNNGCTVFTDGGVGSACSNGPSPTFPASGGNLTCPCTAQGTECFSGNTQLPTGSTTAGSCCKPDVCPPNSCGTIVDHCTGQTKQCSCAAGSGTHCNSGSGLCEGNASCATHSANGTPGSKCSNGPAFSDMGQPPSLLTCQCNPGSVCSSSGTVVTGANIGTCCQNSVSCGNQCNVTLTNSCTGAAIVCGSGCNGTGTCSSPTQPGTCTPNRNCSQQVPPANGNEGERCSTSPNPIFSAYDGDPTGLTCNCDPGLVCAVAAPAPHPAGVNELGVCCRNTAVCPANACATSVTNTCTGAAINCSCNGSQHCVGNVCVANKNCGDYNASGGVGSACSTSANSAFPGGPGGANLTCPCQTGGGFGNNTCVGATGSTPGTCACTPKTPTNCGDNGQSNGCGGTMSSVCPGAQVCFQNACCEKQTCGPRNQGDACGASSTCGVGLDCPCTQAFMSCGAVTPGVCGCKAKTLADCGVTLPAGQTSADGCGGTVPCPG